MPGFWSSSLFADITLIVQVLFFLILCAGVVAQLQGKYKWHDRLQAPIVVLNILFIVVVMMPTFRLVVGELPGGLNRVPTVVTVIHAGLGGIAQLLAIYCLLAGFKILPRKIGALRYWMWTTYTFWTAAVIFGIGVYITFYLISNDTSADVVAEHDAELIAEYDAESAQESVDDTGSEPPTEPAVEEAVSEHIEEPVQVEPPPSEATEEVVAEHDAEAIAPEPTVESEAEGAATEEAISEHEGDVAEVIEPEFTGEVGQARWQALSPSGTGPGPRYEHAIQYSPATNQVFVFGGQDGNQIFNDVYALDVESLTWRQLAANASVVPPARYSTVMIVDDAGENLYIATGHTQGGANFNDIWKLELATESWTDLTASAGPAPEARYGAPGGKLGGNLVTTHGFGTTRYDDTWRFNVETGQWENISPAGPVPLRRCLFAAATPGDANLVMHGGCASGFGDCFLDDTWILDTTANAWREVLSDVKPVGRQHQSLVSGEAGSNQVILFGGQDASRAARNDVWLLDLNTGSWQPVDFADGPEARYQHAAVWIPNQGMLLFGGQGASGALGDMWLLSLQAPAIEAPAPEPTAETQPEPTLVPTPIPPEPTPTPELVSEHDGE